MSLSSRLHLSVWIYLEYPTYVFIYCSIYAVHTSLELFPFSNDATLKSVSLHIMFKTDFTPRYIKYMNTTSSFGNDTRNLLG